MTATRSTIYLDHAAATPVRPEVLAAMAPYWSGLFANPSSITAAGVAARAAIESARATITALIGLQPHELIFTSSGTESTNLAIAGSLTPADHLIVSAVEHHAVLEAAWRHERRGGALTVIPVDQAGVVHLAAIEVAIRPATRLISVMAVNNEIGTIEPLIEIRRLMHRHNRRRQAADQPLILLHTDACQASAYLDLAALMRHSDLLSLNAAKIGGPKGIGALLIRHGLPLTPQIVGGGQESARRAGTENVPAIVGFARAIVLAQAERAAESVRLTALRDDLWHRLHTALPDLHLNGHSAQRVANNLNILVPQVEAEPLLLYLDHDGVTIGIGAACDSQTLAPSHVLRAIGLSEKDALSSIRITLGATTDQADIQTASRLIINRIQWLRKHMG